MRPLLRLRNVESRYGAFVQLWATRGGRGRVLAFKGRVAAFVGSRRVAGDPRRIPLGPHTVITLEIGRYVRPHANYAFPPGLR